MPSSLWVDLKPLSAEQLHECHIAAVDFLKTLRKTKPKGQFNGHGAAGASKKRAKLRELGAPND